MTIKLHLNCEKMMINKEKYKWLMKKNIFVIRKTLQLLKTESKK